MSGLGGCSKTREDDCKWRGSRRGRRAWRGSLGDGLDAAEAAHLRSIAIRDTFAHEPPVLRVEIKLRINSQKQDSFGSQTSNLSCALHLRSR